jgi:hypothetical protein
MKITTLPPIDRILGEEREVHMERTLTVASVLRQLIEEEPEFAPYAGFGPKDAHSYGLLVWREGEALTLDDEVHPTDKLEMLLMIPGG